MRKVRQDPDLTRKELVNELGLPVSSTTLRRALHEYNLRKWKARKRVFILEETAKEWLVWILEWKGREDELVTVTYTEDQMCVCALTMIPGHLFR